MWTQFQKKFKNHIFREDVNLLFDPSTGSEFYFNESGSYIIKQLLSNFTQSEVVGRVSSEFNIEVSEVEKDINSFLLHLKNAENKEDKKFLQLEKKVDESLIQFPFAVEIELTKLCNLNCSFCYNVWKNDSTYNTGINNIPTTSVYNILDECKLNQVFRIRYSGGEPTLHPNFQNILQYGADLGFSQVVFTNGTTVDKVMAQKWKECNVQEVLLSLHGTKELHDSLTGKSGTYEQVIKAIHIFKQIGLKVTIEVTLTKDNIQTTISLLDIIKKLGIKNVSLMRYVATGKNDNKFAIENKQMLDLLNILEENNSFDLNIVFPCSQKFCLSDDFNKSIQDDDIKFREKYLLRSCKAGLTWFSISHDGFIRMCPHSNQYFDNVIQNTTSIKSVWQNKIRPFYFDKIHEKENTCKGCKAFSKCQSGCLLY